MKDFRVLVGPKFDHVTQRCLSLLVNIGLYTGQWINEARVDDINFRL